MSHLKSNILATWFENRHSPKVKNLTFPTDANFEHDLSESRPLEGDELQMYESRYHGPFNHSIGKLIHFQQWICYDINFAMTHLESFTRKSNKPAILILEHLMQYLQSHLHESIFFQ